MIYYEDEEWSFQDIEDYSNRNGSVLKFRSYDPGSNLVIIGSRIKPLVLDCLHDFYGIASSSMDILSRKNGSVAPELDIISLGRVGREEM